ncbi:hypothetical protein D5F01_LYC06688 [Larimichthys crocea]|uniref:Reverse transcriptase domain-containing protein n=1 Tax=Larimichthys crocea TaxID=215358 RepID=A0A6G0IQF2_LARCR|nr:hypothetical protein D5F01_LYC06688 [Larimichthys crocea]
MLRTADVLQVVSEGDWFTSIDLKDAYFHVPIAHHHRQFLRFAFKGQAYQFRVRTSHLHEMHCGSPAEQGRLYSPLFGRLAHLLRNPRAGHPRHVFFDPCEPVGSYCEFHKELFSSQSVWVNGLGLNPKRHQGRMVVVSSKCLQSLKPWRSRAYLSSGVPLGSLPSRREVVVTDASLLDWDAVCNHRTVRGTWSPQQRLQHINVLELRAVPLALRHFLPFLEGRHVFVRSDNTSIVYHVNHQGGTRSRHSLQDAQRLLHWAMPKASSGGVEAEPRGGSDGMGEVWQSGCRPVRLSGVNALPAVVFPLGTDEPVGAGCPGTLLARPPPVCFSSSSTAPVDTSQDSQEQSLGVTGGSLLA